MPYVTYNQLTYRIERIFRTLEEAQAAEHGDVVAHGSEISGDDWNWQCELGWHFDNGIVRDSPPIKFGERIVSAGRKISAAYFEAEAALQEIFVLDIINPVSVADPQVPKSAQVAWGTIVKDRLRLWGKYVVDQYDALPVDSALTLMEVAPFEQLAAKFHTEFHQDTENSTPTSIGLRWFYFNAIRVDWRAVEAGSLYTTDITTGGLGMVVASSLTLPAADWAMADAMVERFGYE